MYLFHFQKKFTNTRLDCIFLAAALAACSSSQYHVVLVVLAVLVVLVVPELLYKFEYFGFLTASEVTFGLLRVNLG